MAVTEKSSSLEVVDEAGKRRAGVRRCLTQIKLSEKEFGNWIDEGKAIIKRFRAEKGRDPNEAKLDDSAVYNLFWSGLQTRIPSLYARNPIPQVERRHRDKDVLARTASEILERATRFQLDAYDFGGCMEMVVQDNVLPGRGIARVYYEPEFGEVTGPDGTVEKRVVRENVYCRYVNWEDFQHNSARTWDEVSEVRFRSYMSREEVEARFGKDKAKELKYTHLPSLCDDTKTVAEEEQGDYKKAIVWEIWHKPTRTVKWVSDDYKEDYLDLLEDPLGLEGFFPCPRPLYATLTSDTLIPVPDARQCKKLYNQLDDVQAKIAALTEDLRVAGVYDASYPEIARVMTEGEKLIPVRNYAALQKNGGLMGAMEFLSLEHIVAALGVLYQQKDQLRADIYEITGESDIMRGVSDPRETAEAQQRKAMFGSIRLTKRQGRVQEFARDLISLTAEVIAEHFSAETLMAMTGLEFISIPPEMMPRNPDGSPPHPQMIEQAKLQVYGQAVELLRNDPMRRFRISVETDSTIAIDEAVDRQNKADYLATAIPMLDKLPVLSQQMPQVLPLFGEMMLFASRAYKVGRNLESQLEEFIEQSKQLAEAAKSAPQPPDPKMVEIQGKMQIEQQRAQNEAQLAQMKLDQEIKLAQTKADLEQVKAALKHQADIDKLQNDILLERARLEADIRVQEAQAQADMSIQAMKIQLDAAAQREKEVIASSGTKGGRGTSSEIVINTRQPKKKKVVPQTDEAGNRHFIVEDLDDEAVN